jgi:hypothetical protein
VFGADVLRVETQVLNTPGGFAPEQPLDQTGCEQNLLQRLPTMQLPAKRT